MPASLGELIRERRVALGWTQPELAAKLAVTQQTLSRWENDSARPRSSKMPTLAAVLEVNLRDIEALPAPTRPELIQELPPLRMTLPFAQLDEVQFEQFAAALLEEQNPGSSVYRNGERGHAQQGIDVFVDHPDARPRDGVQCKRVAQFGEANVLRAIAEFDPATGVESPVIYLSRVASSGARRAVRENPPWRMMDSEDLSRAVTRLDPDQQLRLIRRFFPTLREAFLGVRHPSPWLTADEFRAPLDRADSLFSQAWDLVGRDGEITQLEEFIASGRDVFVVEAPAGTGKTRLLLGLAEKHEADPELKVRFLAPDAEVETSDFELLPDGALVLLVDDAHRRNDIAAIVRGVLGARPQTHLVLAIRGHSRPDVGEQLRLVGRAITVGENLLLLGGLTFTQARQLAVQVGSPEITNPLALDALAQLGVDSPFFAVVGAQLVKQGRVGTPTLESSPELRNQILDAFRDALVGDGTAAEVELRNELLAALAAMQPFRSDEPAFQEALQSLLGKSFRLLMPTVRQLEEAGLLLRRGASYRVTPDLLGDIVLARALVFEESGLATSYASELVSALPDKALEHALINVGRVDFQLQMAGKGVTVLEALWTPFLAEIRSADPHRRIELAGLLRDVAYHQPARSLDAVRWILDHPFIGPPREGEVERLLAVAPPDNARVDAALIAVLERIAYHEDLLPDAMRLLRGLIRGTLDQTGNNDDPAAAVLRKLLDYNHPLEFVSAAMDVLLGWLSEPDISVAERLTILEILRPILATEVSNTRSEGMTVFFGSRLIRASTVKPLRDRVVAVMFEELSAGEPSRVRKGGELLHDALLVPTGMFGQDVPDEEVARWAPALIEVIDQISDRVRAGVSQVEVELIRAAIRWHATYGADEISEKARELWASLPMDLPSSVGLALRDGSPFIEAEDFEAEMRERKAWQEQTAQELLATHDDDTILDLVERELKENQSLGTPGDPVPFMVSIFAGRPGLASLTLDRLIADPELAMVAVAGLALQHELALDEPQGAVHADALLTSGSEPLRRLAAQALALTVRLGLEHVPGGLDRLGQLLRDHDEVVVRQALFAVRVLSESDQQAALRLLDALDMGNLSKGIIGDVASMFGRYGNLRWNASPKAFRDRLLQAITDLPDIEDHNIEQLFALAAQEEPDEVIALVQRRIERAEAAPRDLTYRPIPYRWRARFVIPTSSSRDAALLRIWNWMSQDTTSWNRQRDGAKLWWSVAGPFEEVLPFLLERAQEPGANFSVMANLLQELPQTFVATNPEFVIEVLNFAHRQGAESFSKVASGFHGAMISGGHSRAIGVPNPDDVAARERFTEIAQSQPRGPAREFYESMAASVQRDIDHHAADDEELLDRHQW